MQFNSLNDFLQDKGLNICEGHCGQVIQQQIDLANLTSTPNIRVMEIGFNAGHSAENFLSHNPTMTLVSFDIGHHDYVLPGKEYIDAKFPGRHTLIIGDSQITVPEYSREHAGEKFDVIFIDGNHDFPVANTDFENCMKLAHKDTVVIMDDTMYNPDWTAGFNIGPTQVWINAEKSNRVFTLDKRDYMPGRGMSCGKYIL